MVLAIMHFIFVKKSSLSIQILLLIFCSVIIMIFDSFGYLTRVRFYLDAIVFPIHFLVDKPYRSVERLVKSLENSSKVIDENIFLRQKLFLKKSEQLLLENCRKENENLRLLLNSPLKKRREKKVLARIVFSKIGHYTDQILVNKGSRDGVSVGQAVINDQGIVGQIISVNHFTSFVLLICDTSHALPTKILRNNLSCVLFGQGLGKDLRVGNFSDDLDIRVGDLLVTSGLDGRFPEGYPVAVISSIIKDREKDIFLARPTANLKNLFYLLILNDREF